MKISVIVFACLVAITAGDEGIYHNFVKVNIVSDRFGKGVSDAHFQRLEQRLKYGTLFEQFANITKQYVNDMVTELYRQVRLESELLGNSVVSIHDQITYSLSALDPKKTYNFPLEKKFTKLNHQMKTLLSYKPGPSLPEQEKLIDIPPPDSEFHYFLAYHPLDQLFLHVDTLIDTHLSNLRLIINSLYASGWKEARPVFAELQKQFRDEFLNKQLISIYEEVIESLYEHHIRIKQYVTEDTWRIFEENVNVFRSICKQLHDGHQLPDSKDFYEM